MSHFFIKAQISTFAATQTTFAAFCLSSIMQIVKSESRQNEI